jgi:hypothetical protein
MGIYADLEQLAKEDPDGAVRECALLLDKNPDDALALFLIGTIYAEAERCGAAANMFRRVCDLRPEKSEGWNNLGMAYEGLKRPNEAVEYFRKAWGIDKKATYASNIGNCYLAQEQFDIAIQWAQRALLIDRDCRSAKSVLAIASLSKHDWATGWDNYEALLGGKFRKEVQYQEEGRWDGSPGKTLIVYGEQGLGDEVMYASCIPDVARDNRVALECDRRLEGLFRRSFPDVNVHGTRRESVSWLSDYQFEGRCSIGTLPKFFRRKTQDFPGTPYLIADPERRLQWRALLASFGDRPKIGIAWSGGSKHNNPQARAIGLEGMRPLIEGVDATWVSLQYQDPAAEIAASGMPVKHWPRATLTADYDDTAGLVAELDLVIGPHTSVHHLAGALGVRSLILVPDKTIWVYGGDSLPWYRTATLIKQAGNWSKTVESLLSHPVVRGLRPA